MNDELLKDTNNDRCQTTKSESTHLEGDGTLAKGKDSHTEDNSTTAHGQYAHAEGYNTKSLGVASHAEGAYTKANAPYSHAEGHGTHTDGDESHSEGYCTTAFGDLSHSEGNYSTAGGKYSHAEGCFTAAKGESSHAEGSFTQTKGHVSHAEGYKTKANAYASHAEGHGTIAENCYEHAQGSFNVSNNGVDDDKCTLFSIGIGLSDDKRSNAVEVMQNGDMYVVGIGGFDGKNYKEAKTLQESIGKGKCDDTNDLRNDAYRFFNSLMAVIDHIQRVSDKINTFIDMSVIEAVFKNYSAAFGFTAKVEDTYVKLTYKGIEVVVFITHNDKREADVKAFIDEMTASTMNMPRIVKRYLNLAR